MSDSLEEGVERERTCTKNTVAKDRSSNGPRLSRTTAMNHRKLIPANGISTVAMAMPLCWVASHPVESLASSGMLWRIRNTVVPNSTAKSTPASAAARGVVNGRTVDPEDTSDSDTAPSCQSTRPEGGFQRSTPRWAKPIRATAQRRFSGCAESGLTYMSETPSDTWPGIRQGCRAAGLDRSAGLTTRTGDD